MLRVSCSLLALLALLTTGIVLAGPAKKPKPDPSSSLAEQMATWRKQEGEVFNQFQDAVAKVKKQLDDTPSAAGSAAAQLETFIDSMSLQLNVALRSGRLRATDKMPTKQGTLTGPQMLKELARVRREVSNFAVKYGDKAARRERLVSLEKSYDWQQRQPSAMAAFETAGRVRYAYAVATSRVSEADRFEKLAAETKKLGGVTDATPLKYGKSTVTLSAALSDVKKLGRQARKDQQRLRRVAAEEQKRAEAAHRAALSAKAKPSGTVAPAARPSGTAAPAARPSTAPAWREEAVSAPLQTSEGDLPVESSPEPAAEEAGSNPSESAPAEAAPAEQAPAAPACNPSGATCGNDNPPDNPCCQGTTCTSRFQYSDGSLGIGYCQ